MTNCDMLKIQDGGAIVEKLNYWYITIKCPTGSLTLDNRLFV